MTFQKICGLENTLKSKREDSMSKHPIQPLEKDDSGVMRFKKNKIVDFLLDGGGFDLNMIATMGFSSEDREQFAQLIGYSLSGFGELGYVNPVRLYGCSHIPYPGLHINRKGSGLGN